MEPSKVYVMRRCDSETQQEEWTVTDSTLERKGIVYTRRDLVAEKLSLLDDRPWRDYWRAVDHYEELIMFHPRALAARMERLPEDEWAVAQVYNCESLQALQQMLAHYDK